MPFDYREVENALRSRGIKGDCPACGDADPDQWDAHLVAIPVLNSDSSFIAGNGIIRAAALVCSSCGFMRLFSLKRLGVDID